MQISEEKNTRKIKENWSVMQHFPEINEEIMVSIILTVYNHEKYLARALDSILRQHTKFKFEIIIGDDASKDRSAEILSEYAEKYPQVIQPVFREVNIGGSKNFTDLFRKCRGRYVTFMDGDDYWIDLDKLQIQFDFLESYPDIIAVSHKVSVCDAGGIQIRVVPKDSFDNGAISISHFLKGKRFPITATMIRALHGSELEGLLRLVDAGPRNAGDTTICLFLLDKAPIYILDRSMTVYRYRSTAGHSNYNSITKLPEKILDKMKLLRINDDYFSGKYFFGWLYIRLAASAARGLIINKGHEVRQLLMLLLRIASLLCKTAFNYFYVQIKNRV